MENKEIRKILKEYVTYNKLYMSNNSKQINEARLKGSLKTSPYTKMKFLDFVKNNEAVIDNFSISANESSVIFKNDKIPVTFIVIPSVGDDNELNGIFPLSYLDGDEIKPTKFSYGTEIILSTNSPRDKVENYGESVADVMNSYYHDLFMLFFNNWFYSYEPLAKIKEEE